MSFELTLKVSPICGAKKCPCMSLYVPVKEHDGQMMLKMMLN